MNSPLPELLLHHVQTFGEKRIEIRPGQIVAGRHRCWIGAVLLSFAPPDSDFKAQNTVLITHSDYGNASAHVVFHLDHLL